ncbi:MAG: hypothetical protein GX638_09725, partial [Crenarchaeota archaeon]|nr:hypothetical protein [Thermoproteota archaeon]
MTNLIWCIMDIPLLKKAETAKILSILCFVLILLSLYIIYQSPGVDGYEVSIYDEYPKYFWYLILLSIYICQFILLLNIVTNIDDSASWKAACIGISLCISILILLPMIKRYAIYGGGDPSTHMGYILDILHSGHIGSNMYPIVHISGMILSQLCGFDLQISMLLYPCIIYLIYVISFYLLFRIVLNSKAPILICMILAPVSVVISPGLINSVPYFAPQAISDYFISFYLFLFISRYISSINNFNYAILIVLMSLFLTFVHPLTSLFLAVILSIFIISHGILNRLSIFDFNSKLNAENTCIDTARNLLLIIILIFFIWQSYSYLLLETFKTIYIRIFLDVVGYSKFELYSDQMSMYSPNIYFLLKTIVYLYGVYIIIVFMGAISIAILYITYRIDNVNLNLYSLTLSLGFIFFSMLYVASQFIPTSTGYVRVGYYAAMLSILLIPVAFGYLYEMRDSYDLSSKLLIFIVFPILVVFITYLIIFTLFESPLTLSLGAQVTDSQLMGMETFFEKRSDELEIMQLTISVSRMKDALYGQSKKLDNVKYETPQVPDHFGYINISYF